MRDLSEIRDSFNNPDGFVQRYVAPLAAFAVTLIGAEAIRRYAQRAVDDWADMRERADKLVRLYGEASDAYWHVRAATEALEAGGPPEPVPDFGTTDQTIERLATEVGPDVAGGEPADADVGVVPA